MVIVTQCYTEREKQISTRVAEARTVGPGCKLDSEKDNLGTVYLFRSVPLSPSQPTRTNTPAVKKLTSLCSTWPASSFIHVSPSCMWREGREKRCCHSTGACRVEGCGWPTLLILGIHQEINMYKYAVYAIYTCTYTVYTTHIDAPLQLFMTHPYKKRCFIDARRCPYIT